MSEIFHAEARGAQRTRRGEKNGEWGMGNEEWGMGNGEWGMRNFTTEDTELHGGGDEERGREMREMREMSVKKGDCHLISTFFNFR